MGVVDWELVWNKTKTGVKVKKKKQKVSTDWSDAIDSALNSKEDSEKEDLIKKVRLYKKEKTKRDPATIAILKKMGYKGVR